MDGKIIDKIHSYNKDFNQEKIGLAYDYVINNKEDLDFNDFDLDNVLDLLFPLRPDEETILAVFLHDLYLMGVIPEDNIKDKFGKSVLQLLMQYQKH